MRNPIINLFLDHKQIEEVAFYINYSSYLWLPLNLINPTYLTLTRRYVF